MEAHHSIRPMSSGEVIRHGLAIWKKAPFQLSLINLPGVVVRGVLVVLLILIQYLSLYIFEGISRLAVNAEGIAATVFLLLLIAAFSLATMFLLLMLNYYPILAMIFAASNLVLRRPVSAGQALRRTTSRHVFKKYSKFVLFFLLAVLLLNALLIVLVKSPILGGLPLNELVVALLIFFATITVVDIVSFLALPILALEKRDALQAAHRLVSFLREFGRHILWTYFLSYWLPFTATATPLIFLIFFTTNVEINASRGFYLLLFFLSIAVIPFNLVFSSIGTIVMILSYYDVRSRKEQYGEEVLAEEMGYAPLAEMIGV